MPAGKRVYRQVSPPSPNAHRGVRGGQTNSTFRTPPLPVSTHRRMLVPASGSHRTRPGLLQKSPMELPRVSQSTVSPIRRHPSGPLQSLTTVHRCCRHDRSRVDVSHAPTFSWLQSPPAVGTEAEGLQLPINPSNTKEPKRMAFTYCRVCVESIR
jgi:hypothetical protein